MSPYFSRRNILLGMTASGVLIATAGLVNYPRVKRAYRNLVPKDVPANPTVFISIDPDGAVTLLSKHLEMGQGIMTGLATAVAEEMDADWAQMRTRHAPANAEHYQNLYYGRQVTAASSSLGNSWKQMRLIGAGARHMLVSAAANRWDVSTSEIDVENGVIKHAKSGRSLSFGDVAEAARQQPAPKTSALRLKSRKDWKLIGGAQRRIDANEKLSGTAVFGIDLEQPDMLRATVLRSPRFGGTLLDFDAKAALALKGVLEVFAVPTGVAIVAEDTWTAFRARNLVVARWDNSAAETRSSSEIFDHYAKMAETEGEEFLSQGNADAALSDAASRETISFQFDYMPHAPMEPLNAVMERTKDGGVHISTACQAQTLEQLSVAAVFGVTKESVTIDTHYAGSSFGRRVYPRSDWLPELAEIVKESKLDRPIQMVWTRETDLSGGAYRPMSVHRAELAFDKDNALIGWRHRAVCQSLLQDTPWGGLEPSVRGLRKHPYDIPNHSLQYHNPQHPVPVGFWRSVGDSHNNYVLETITDIAAHRAGADPVAYRLALLENGSRQKDTLNAVASAAKWGDPSGPNVFKGVAINSDTVLGQHSAIAMVAEIRLIETGFSLERIVVAANCGTVLNPDIVRAQIEGSVAYALSAAYRHGITLNAGIVEQSNFGDFEPTRLSEMPTVDVIILPSQDDPSGIGEVAVAPVAPAIGNALFAATGRRHHSLPISDWDI